MISSVDTMEGFPNLPNKLSEAPEAPQHDRCELPDEIWERVFSYVPLNQLFDKLLGNFEAVQLFGRLQQIAFECILSGWVVINNRPATTSGRRFIFSPMRSKTTVFTVNGYENGLKMFKSLIKYNFELKRHTSRKGHLFPREIILLFHVSEDVNNQVEYFVRTIELLNINNFYTDLIPSIIFQLSYNSRGIKSLELESANTRIIQKVESLSNKISKIHIDNQSVLNPKVILNTLTFENLDELYLWNLNIDYYLYYLFSISRSSIRVLDLLGNKITELSDVSLPQTLKKCIVRANRLQSLANLDFSHLMNLELIDFSINSISDLSNFRLPPNLRILKLNYNDLVYLDDLRLPQSLEVLEVFNNYIGSIDGLDIPSNIHEIHLNNNRLVGIPDHFLLSMGRLRFLNLSENKIDDLDEIGVMPDCLEELYLDNNEIDHHTDLVNILTPNLTILSMTNTGLMNVSNIVFPSNLRLLNLAKNEIVEFENITFPEKFQTLNLSGNQLSSFLNNIVLPEKLFSLDLSDNNFDGFRDITLPAKLNRLKFDNNRVGVISDKLLGQLPRTLVDLSLSYTDDTKSDPPFQFEKHFPSLKKLSIRNDV